MEPREFFAVLLFLLGLSLIGHCKGTLKCECSTEECRSERRSTCSAGQYCYVENFHGEITRGCIDERTPLLCENRKPHGMVGPWPLMYCCKNRNFCNRHVLPTPEPSAEGKEDDHTPEPESKVTKGSSDCSQAKDKETKKSSSGPKIINPIYIAVPVAGVCVLLALIIFAMYLLRRRSNDYYETYHHYHDQHGHVLQAPRPCTCKKTAAACGGKVNRCTDSERSSSGSETKLFLQA